MIILVKDATKIRDLIEKLINHYRIKIYFIRYTKTNKNIFD